MKHDIVKEFRYGLRNSRFLIIMASFVFFAVMTPIMVKLILPMILASQFPGMGEDLIAEMIDMSQTGTVRNYLSDVYEIGTLIITFSLCGLIAQEIRDNTLVIPLCAGRRIHNLLIAKMLVFGSALLITPVIALIICYAYAGLLFSFDIGLLPVITSGLLQGTYMVFLLSCLIFFGSIIKKPIAAGLLSLAATYGLHIVAGLLDIHKYMPSGLLQEAMLLSDKSLSGIILPLIITISLIIALPLLSLIRLRRMEWNERSA